MAIFWSKSLLTRGFAQQRSAGGEEDGHAAEEEKTAAKAGGSGDGPDQRRAGQESEVAQDADGRDRRPPAAVAAETPRGPEERRRRQRQPRPGDDEPGERDKRMLGSRGDDRPGCGSDAGEEHPCRDGRAFDPLREQPPGRHRAGEEPGAEAADRGARMERVLQEERAPRFEAALDDERDREDDPDDQ